MTASRYCASALPSRACACSASTPAADSRRGDSCSAAWLAHARAYVEKMTAEFGLGPQSRVIEVASNDGYLLQFVKERGGVQAKYPIFYHAGHIGHFVIVGIAPFIQTTFQFVHGAAVYQLVELVVVNAFGKQGAGIDDTVVPSKNFLNVVGCVHLHDLFCKNRSSGI